MSWDNAQEEAKFWKEQWVQLCLERMVSEWMSRREIHSMGVSNRMNLWVVENAPQLAEFYSTDEGTDFGLTWLFDLVHEYGETAITETYNAALQAFSRNKPRLM